MDTICETDFSKRELVNLVNNLRQKNINLNYELENSIDDCHWLDHHRQNLLIFASEQKINVDNLKPTWEEWRGYCKCIVCKQAKCLINNNLEKVEKCECESCSKEVSNLGYNKSMIVNVTKNLLSKIQVTYGRDNKIDVVKQLFRELQTNDGKFLIEKYNNFSIVVKNKLQELYCNEKLFEAYIFYRRLFGYRIPV